MRNGQNKRMRGRNNHRKGHNSMARVYESNGPDVKIRGNPSHIAEKYIQLARDAQASGDPVAAENYYQHAEHYFRVIASAQEQFRQSNPHFSRPESDSQIGREDSFDEGDDDGQSTMGDTPYGTREPQPFLPREGQSFAQSQAPQGQPFRSPQESANQPAEADCLPSFITGSQQSTQPLQAGSGRGQNGHDSHSERFPLHRRRRRHRGPRHEVQGSGQGGSGEGGDESSRRGD
jgi:hypothetical protein